MEETTKERPRSHVSSGWPDDTEGESEKQWENI
jgi:hypothetical protein